MKQMKAFRVIKQEDFYRENEETKAYARYLQPLYQRLLECFVVHVCEPFERVFVQQQGNTFVTLPASTTPLIFYPYGFNYLAIAPTACRQVSERTFLFRKGPLKRMNVHEVVIKKATNPPDRKLLMQCFCTLANDRIYQRQIRVSLEGKRVSESFEEMVSRRISAGIEHLRLEAYGVFLEDKLFEDPCQFILQYGSWLTNLPSSPKLPVQTFDALDYDLAQFWCLNELRAVMYYYRLADTNVY
jgi:hypothetical protein